MASIADLLCHDDSAGRSADHSRTMSPSRPSLSRRQSPQSPRSPRSPTYIQESAHRTQQSPNIKRPAPTSTSPNSPPAKKQTKWTPEEDRRIIELRGQNVKWEDISKQLPGRSPISCRLHYQNYLERRSEWDEDKKDKLARLYERFKPDMWKMIAKEMQIPWRAAEAMHWQLGEKDMAQRAGVVPFSLTSQAVDIPRTASRSRENSSMPSPGVRGMAPEGWGVGNPSASERDRYRRPGSHSPEYRY